MIQLSSKSDDSSLCYDVIIIHQKLTNLMIIRVVSILTERETFKDIIPTIIN